MNCISWNGRGVANKPTVRELVGMVKATKSKLVFLCETRQSSEKVKRLCGRLGLRGFSGVSSDGLSGGLALFWCESLHVEVQSASERYIDAHVRLSEHDPLWRLTCVYGEPRVENRHRMWTQMRTLKQSSDLPWCVIGDFNEAMWSFEHFSLTPRNEGQMLAFRDMLEVCELVDLGFSGLPFTYDNKQHGRKNVRVRLDRAVADNKWRDIFSEARVVHNVSPCSDHTPLMLECIKEDTPDIRCKFRRYEAFWERDPTLPEKVAAVWEQAGRKFSLGDVRAGLTKLMVELHAWGKKKFGNITQELERCRCRLEELMNMNADRNEIREVSDHMQELLYREEMLWMQRSRIDWLRNGDRNTKFFQNRAKWRARRNKVKRLIDAAGCSHGDSKVMGGMATSFFENLFTRDDSLDPQPVLSLFEEKVSQEMNNRLCAEFTEKEISDSLFQMGPLKAPGKDGFPARFFQKNWAVMKEEIVMAVREFFRTSNMPQGVNDTVIVLIPKVDDPVRLTDFRPISLCNVIYKIVAKCLVNRLRPVLDEIISPYQSAFVPGRLITDNALLAFECLHFIQHEKNPENSFCAYKLNLSKAYDRVDWGFLGQAMIKLGFSHQWVQWIMSCVTTVRYPLNSMESSWIRLHRHEGFGKVTPYRLSYFYLWLMVYLHC